MLQVINTVWGLMMSYVTARLNLSDSWVCHCGTCRNVTGKPPCRDSATATTQEPKSQSFSSYVSKNKFEHPKLLEFTVNLRQQWRERREGNKWIHITKIRRKKLGGILSPHSLFVKCFVVLTMSEHIKTFEVFVILFTHLGGSKLDLSC